MKREDVVALLRRRAKEAGSQDALAEELGISRAFLTNILAGRKKPSAKILAQLGLRRVNHYEPVDDDDG